MPEIRQEKTTIKQNNRIYYKTVGKLSSETFGAIGCFGISTSREEYQQNFEKIVLLSEILNFEISYFMISGVLNRFNTSIPQMSEDKEANFGLCVKLANSIFNTQQFYYQANEQGSTLIPEPAVFNALKIEEDWLEKNQGVINKYNLNIISGSFYIYLYKPELFENFPLQKEIFAKFFKANPDHKKFRDSFKKAAKLISNCYQDNLEQSKNRKPVIEASKNDEAKAEEIIKLIIERVKNDKNGKLYLVNDSKEYKFRDGVNKGALKYLERKCNEFIELKIQTLTNQYTINISEQDEFEIQAEANKIYNTPYAFACAVLYLLEEYTNFYFHTKRLQFTHYLYLGELKSMPGDKAFKEEVLENQAITQGLFKYVALHSTTLEKFDQYRRNIEALYNTQSNGLFDSNSFPGNRSPDYLPNLMQRQHTGNTHDSLIKAKSKTTDDIANSSMSPKPNVMPMHHTTDSNNRSLSRVRSKAELTPQPLDEQDNHATVNVEVDVFYELVGKALTQTLKEHKKAGSDPQEVLDLYKILNKKSPSPSSSGVFSRRLSVEPIDPSESSHARVSSIRRPSQSLAVAFDEQESSSVNGYNNKSKSPPSNKYQTLDDDEDQHVSKASRCNCIMQ